MKDVFVEQCGSSGVVVEGRKIVAICTNVEVRRCGRRSGMVAMEHSHMILTGDETSVHHNCTKGESDNYGLKVYNSSSHMELYFPLTKENVSIYNGGGGNWTNHNGLENWIYVQTCMYVCID